MADGNGTNGRVPSVQAELEAAFQMAFDKAFPGLHEKPVLMQTKEARFGDYQCNSAMKLFNQLKGKVRQEVYCFSFLLPVSRLLWKSA